jgi:hypothetical protein
MLPFESQYGFYKPLVQGLGRDTLQRLFALEHDLKMLAENVEKSGIRDSHFENGETTLSSLSDSEDELAGVEYMNSNHTQNESVLLNRLHLSRPIPKRSDRQRQAVLQHPRPKRKSTLESVQVPKPVAKGTGTFRRSRLPIRTTWQTGRPKRIAEPLRPEHMDVVIWVPNTDSVTGTWKGIDTLPSNLRVELLHIMRLPMQDKSFGDARLSRYARMTRNQDTHVRRGDCVMKVVLGGGYLSCTLSKTRQRTCDYCLRHSQVCVRFIQHGSKIK